MAHEKAPNPAALQAEHVRQLTAQVNALKAEVARLEKDSEKRASDLKDSDARLDAAKAFFMEFQNYYTRLPVASLSEAPALNVAFMALTADAFFKSEAPDTDRATTLAEWEKTYYKLRQDLKRLVDRESDAEQRAERAERELKEANASLAMVSASQIAAWGAMHEAGIEGGQGISLVFAIHQLTNIASENARASDEWKASCETAQYETVIARQSRARLVWLTREFRQMIETAIKQMNLANTVIRGASAEIDELKDVRDQAEKDNRTLRDELRAARPDEASYERLRWMIQHVANVEIIKRWEAEKERDELLQGLNPLTERLQTGDLTQEAKVIDEMLREVKAAMVVVENTSAHDGLSNAQIAARLCIEVGTVKQHLHSIYARLKVNGRAPYGGRVVACAIVFTEAK